MATVLCSCSSVSYAGIESFDASEDLSVFLGIDVQGRNLDLEKDFGENLFAKRHGQYDLYAGFRIFDYFGLSIGHTSTKSKERNSVLNEGEKYLGVQIDAGDGIESHITSKKIKGTHVDLLGFYPVYNQCKIDIFGSIGLTRNKLTLKDDFVALDGLALAPTIVRNYDEKKTTFRLMLGIQAVVLNHLGVRASLGWENTSKFKDLKPLEVPNAATNVKLKDSFIYGIGVFVTT